MNHAPSDSIPAETQNGTHIGEQLNSQSLAFVEQLFAEFQRDPTSVPEQWRAWFREEMLGQEGPPPQSAQSPFGQRSLFNPTSNVSTNGKKSSDVQDMAGLQERLDQLIRNFRVRGHIIAAVDPLDQPRSSPAELDPAFYGFTEQDLQRPMSTEWFGGPEVNTIRAMIKWLQTTYCRSIGAQFMHIDSLSVRQWLQDRMEKTANHIKLGRDEQLRILTRLSNAVLFEEFIQTKFVGAKSFSLEGAESLIPLLDMAIDKAGDDGVREIVLGMAHRGRLNVLANILGKSPRLIFREFEDKDPELNFGRGDVKYHLGHSSDWTTAGGNEVHLTLCFNPSHLEFVNPVAVGRLRAKQDRKGDTEGHRSMAILIHGDAAFAGEGIVQETLNLSELPGYSTGGTIHVIVNNQIGFTTGPKEARSSTYATDVAKMLQSPIFHVNGEDPEAVAQVVDLALDFRREFQRDVIIDMYCYRRRGHNEGDEPMFTQPVMYRAIKNRPTVFEAYLNHLLSLRGMTKEEADAIIEDRRKELEKDLAIARRDTFIQCVDKLGGVWLGYHGGHVSKADHVSTAVDKSVLSEILKIQTELPVDFTPHPKINRLLSARREMAGGKRPLDWGAAEALAMGTVVAEGTRLRLSGQDVGRGTFSHRHAVLCDYDDGHPYIPLRHLAPEQGAVDIFNSPLSEAGVLGFEYGYSLDCPDGLVIWEAQFGDFANTAQVIFDQFIASGEDKWDRLSGVVVLLPHGFEGQGPEHSSARLERFLSLAADDNMQIVSPTTPAQMFHCLRRQVLCRWKKPLIVMTPKSLLRHPEAVSTLDECATGEFQYSIPDALESDPAEVKRILLCTGKVYYDLIAERAEWDRHDVAIIRIEQLYPLYEEGLDKILADYPVGIPAVWVQDEPENMGAWRYLFCRFGERLFNRFPLSCVCRASSASPATGSARSHRVEQDVIIARAFNRE
ncbi:2-oxoglutarate dehydrogenase E1 component [Symmachiella dynata]|uniref:2-oxoglutarate dehydrogenase E1 component n=1 Tax=Symmachiella dynata TaxID=2527995 RepID=UPI0030EB7690